MKYVLISSICQTCIKLLYVFQSASAGNIFISVLYNAHLTSQSFSDTQRTKEWCCWILYSYQNNYQHLSRVTAMMFMVNDLVKFIRLKAKFAFSYKKSKKHATFNIF